MFSARCCSRGGLDNTTRLESILWKKAGRKSDCTYRRLLEPLNLLWSIHERACIQFFLYIRWNTLRKKAHDACFSVITSSEIICSVTDKSEFRSRVSFRVSASLMEAPNDCHGKLSFGTAVVTKAEITWSYHEMWRIDIFNYFKVGVGGWCMPA